MRDKEFDKLLKGKLEDYQPEYDSSTWEDLESRIENEVVSEPVDPFDNAVKAALGQFAVSDSNGNWEEMERRITEDENASFDEEVRENVENYQAPYDAGSWPVLDEKIAADERFRRRLLGAKILEIAAIMIALITFYNVFPDIKNSLFDKNQESPSQEKLRAEHFTSTTENARVDIAKVMSNTSADASEDQLLSVINTPSSTSQAIGGEQNAVENEREVENGFAVINAGSADYSYTHSRIMTPVVLLDNSNLHDNRLLVEYHKAGLHTYGINSTSVNSTNGLYTNETVSTIEVLGIPEHMDSDIKITSPSVERPKKKKSLRLSIGASMDLNALYMPEENFYADGQQISFSEKNLLATGYSAGFGLLFGDGIWSFETGLHYSAKKYEPNRVIQIGKTFDVRTVDFNEISLHIVSVPMYAHWNFDRKGKTRFYAFAGAGVNLIANAHYDLIVKNNFRSGPSGGVRDKNTDIEVARIQEHILDGAEFSSKSYITASAGLGVEHSVGDKLSFFAQPSFNYQVPFFQFSDQNGKQFKYVSMQLGTRVKLK